MRVRRSLAVVAAVVVALGAVTGAPGARAAATWLDGGTARREVADLSRVPAVALLPDRPASIPLDPPLRFRGALYDALESGDTPGSVRLAWTDGGQRTDPGGLLIRAGGPGLRVVPGSMLQVRRSGAFVALRMAGFSDPAGEPFTADVLVEPAEPWGRIVVQWLQVPTAMKASSDAVLVTDLSRGSPDAVARPAQGGFRLRPGAVLVLPGDVAWGEDALPKAGCGISPSWCDVVRAFDPGCQGSAGTDLTPCSTTEAKRWHFREGQYCRSCPYSLYVTVECGTEMHLPFLDMEGNQIQIIDVFTGVEMELEAINDCARTPFRYCDRCALNQGIIPDPTNTICPAGPWRDCIPYLQRSTLIQWGWPPRDLDGDTVADDLPCGPASTDTCRGTGSGAYAGHEEQNTDVVLRGDPALCGVYRIDIVSGGFDWFLSANCTGIVPTDPAEIERNFRIYQNCADALAAFDPVPELAITRLEYTGVCPDVELVIEVTNLGCVDAPSSPVHLDFERANQDDLDLDLGVVAAGTSVTATVPVGLVATPQNVTGTVDLPNVISECTEQAAGDFSGCQPTAGADTITVTLCNCANTVVPGLADDSLVACNGTSVAVDGSASSVVPCAGGSVEYRVVTSAGAVVRDWSPDPVAWLTPARCPSLDSYQLQVRCSLETGLDCQRSTPFTVECAAAPALSVDASARSVCQGELVTISATPGFGSYAWEDGRLGRVIQDRPGATTTYRVTATTAAGCVAQGEVTVDVLPDPVPGPLGASVRVTKKDANVLVAYQELPAPVASYELVLHAADGAVAPCAASEPPGKPTPVAMEAAPSIGSAVPGAASPQFIHAGGVDACPRLLFYKVVATSPCRRIRGTACNGWPMQGLPCP